MGSCFHFNCVVSESEFSQSKAPNHLQTVNVLYDFVVPLTSQTHHRPAEQVELHCELGGEGSVYETDHFMGRKNVQGVIFEVVNGDNFGVCDFLESVISDFSHESEVSIVPVLENGVFKGFSPFLSLFKTGSVEVILDFFWGEFRHKDLNNYKLLLPL